MRHFIFKYRRHVAFFFLVNFVAEIISPTVALALTSGPSQPEVQEFQAINVSDMVDPSSGDFSYNLPLLEVDGYPLNLSYRAGINMDQEATCVGLGWNLNAGSISRNMRGIPDDFNGDEITKKLNVKDNESYGITIGVGGEIFGIDGASANVSLGLTYNNYSGYDFIQKLGFSLSLGSHASVGLGIASSSDGLTLSPNLNLSASISDKEGKSVKGSASLGTSFNSRSGMREVSLNVSASAAVNQKQANSSKSSKKDNSKNPAVSNLGSIGGGSHIGFGSPTYVPQINMPMNTTAAAGSFKIGGTLFGVDLTADIGGNYSKQKLAQKIISTKAYGYLNLHNGQNADNAMLDFNREKDGTFTEATTHLPIPNLTYDNFSIMGQGVGGSYRPHRSDIGYVYDVRATNTSDNYNLSAELSLGNVVQGGLDFVVTTVTGSSGKWVTDNPVTSNLGFKGNSFFGYEPAYFKEMGEMCVDDDGLYSAIHEDKAVRFELNDIGKNIGLKNSLITENSTVFSLTGNSLRTKRTKRNQLFSYLTVSEYQNLALQTILYSQIARYDASSNLINGHHIAEITTTKTDGSRYVYGLPVYNTLQKEVTFNVGQNSIITTNNLVTYSGSDDSENNSKGIDNFYSSTETPPYAYGYMLTAVLSSDYVDKTGDGPSPDDLGTYTLFDYKLADKVTNYQWRTPHSNNGSGGVATLDEGLVSTWEDNKGSYVYGTKDIYYLSTIQGKNNIAEFLYSSRLDGQGAAMNGGNAGPIQKKLDRINLYSLPDFQLMQTSPGHQATVLKAVHFTYGYDLCQGTYNSSATLKKKLTLNQVHFSFGNSFKGKLSPYIFAYNTTSKARIGGNIVTTTPGYNPADIDRWGNYKANPTGALEPKNSKFPYVEQESQIQNANAALWSLKSIQLPSGGLISIEYESDDYAYIQNRRAGEMFRVTGFDANPNATSLSAPNKLSLATTIVGACTQKYLYFPLKSTAQSSNATQLIADYLDAINYLYFRFYTKVNCGSKNDPSVNYGKSGYEFVHGYMEIDRTSPGAYAGISTIGTVPHGWIRVQLVPQTKNSATMENPISKTAWQFARVHMGKEVYNSNCMSVSDPAQNKTGLEAVLRAIANAGFIKNTIQTFKGYNGALKTNSTPFGMDFEPSLSWVRLTNPDYKKLGGGHRTKRVVLNDKWSWMLDASNPVNASQWFEYGQEYEYIKTESGRTISAGVASYEPSFGADENPFHQPIFMDKHKNEALFAPENNMYVEEPLGECFFPSPGVVYSKMTIRNLAPGAGKTVNEYYTAKDFPTQVHELGMEPRRIKSDPIWSLFSFSTFDHFAGSQGYSIELNDMHGKPKAVHQYEEGGLAPTKSTFYRYRRSGDQLVNTVKTISKSGTIQDSRIGVDFDFYADFRENTSNTEMIGANGNLHFFMIGIFPCIIPSIIPSYHSEEIQLRTAVTNKVIYKYGILDKVESYDNGNLNVTENQLWDSETGQVLLTATSTEFKDPIYSFAYPGHWAYEGLSGGYKNTGLEIGSASSQVNGSGSPNGQINASLSNILFPGDEIAIINGSTVRRGYVDKIGQDYFFTENSQNGPTQTSTPLTQSALSGCKIKVIRSGRHNLQDQKVGAFTSFVSPIKNNPSNWPLLDHTYEITQASAVELGNTWQGYCGCDFVTAGSNAGNAYPNQFKYGIKGNERKIKDYTFLTNRKQTKQNGNSNIRVDGTFETFNPFWIPNAGNDWVKVPNQWTWVSEATKYSSHGFDFENKDALERRSAAQYGFQQTLPVAVTSNSYYKLSASESFEYSDLNFCEDDHFGYNYYRNRTHVVPVIGVKAQKYSHTGKRSIVVPGKDTITIIKQISACTP